MDSPVGSQTFVRAAPTGADIAAAIADFTTAPTPLPLQCGVQHYGWGDPGFIPSLIDVPNPRGLPFAELWIGAHPDLLSTVQLQGWRLSLAELIAAAPETVLGPDTHRRFGPELPFLLKVLAARHPLSIQAHPDRAQALAGYQREDAIGLPLSDARRSYRDCNHKPELLVAITDFYALRGFRPLAAIEAELNAAPELAPLAAQLTATHGGLMDLYRWLMECDQDQVDALLTPLLARYRRERHGREPDPCDRRDWLLEADRLFSTDGRRDRGLFAMLLLNLIALRPGEAIFLPAGELHAYLRGAGIELMANSNNVLRGGLTSKHIDLQSLLATVRIEPGPAEVLQPQQPDAPGGPARYHTPAAEFLLERYTLNAGERRTLNGDASAARLRLGLVLDGQVTLDTPSQPPLGLAPGAAFMVPAACSAELRGLQRSVVFAALVPGTADRSE